MKTRINPTTGREEFWNQPPGLPGIWMERGFCMRCKPFDQCMGFLELSMEEWKSLEDFISQNGELTSYDKVDIHQLKKCSVD